MASVEPISRKIAGGFTARALANLYEQQQRIYNQHDALNPDGQNNGGIWQGVMSLAASALRPEPASDVDHAIQLGIAASWINVLHDGLEENDPMSPIAEGIEIVLSRAAARALGAVIYNHSAEAAGVEAFCIDLREQAMRGLDGAA